MWGTGLSKSPSDAAGPAWERSGAQAHSWMGPSGGVHEPTDDLRTRLAGLEEELLAARAKLAEFAETRNQLKYHQDTLRRTRARLGGPSFHRELQALKNYGYAMAALDPESQHPLRQIQYKLRNYRFAASHGVRVPAVLGSWSRIRDITLSDLPDRFVLKSDGGAASEGVLPLRRLGPEQYVTIDGSKSMTATDILDAFEVAATAKKAWGPYFAEELLAQEGGGVIPDDVKIYVAYGRVLQVLLRRVTEHAKESTVAYKYVAATGEDLGAITTTRNIDSSIPVPSTLPEMVTIAQHLSRAVGVHFCRVDLYHTTRGVVLGEITRTPGGPQTYALEHDRAMGEQFLLAQAAWELDLLHGRPLAMLHGEHAAPNHYPVSHTAHTDPNSPLWRMHVLSCDEWCYRT